MTTVSVPFVHGRFTQFVAISLRPVSRERCSLERFGCPTRSGHSEQGPRPSGICRIGSPCEDGVLRLFCSELVKLREPSGVRVSGPTRPDRRRNHTKTFLRLPLHESRTAAGESGPGRKAGQSADARLASATLPRAELTRLLPSKGRTVNYLRSPSGQMPVTESVALPPISREASCRSLNACRPSFDSLQLAGPPVRSARPR